MTYDEAVRRLANHANQPADGTTSEESYVFTLWRMSKIRSPLDFAAQARDVIACLEVVNLKANGRVPSETVTPVNSTLGRELESIINSLVLAGVEHALSWQSKNLFGAETVRQALLCSWQIGKAWEAILAGDIDCLEEHLNNELFVREW